MRVRRRRLRFQDWQDKLRQLEPLLRKIAREAEMGPLVPEPEAEWEYLVGEDVVDPAAILRDRWLPTLDRDTETRCVDCWGDDGASAAGAVCCVGCCAS